jgi:hypothetical protein
MNPRLILEVRWGKLAGMKAALSAGSTLRVGRTDLSDFALPHDGHMSREHFALSWDGARATLRDLGSATGTMLDGQALSGDEEAEVDHGGWIEAGETHFMVYVEGFTPAPEENEEGSGDDDAGVSADAESAREARAQERKRRTAAEKALFELREQARHEPLYAVLDGARDERILELLREHVEAHRSLYDGTEGETYEDVAPYLAGPMREDSALLDKLVTEGWGKRWGIYCSSRERFAEVRRHWRRFLMVELEELEERVYFRFYDPWVLRVFWDTWDEQQRGELLRGIGRAMVEGHTGDVESIAASAI